ncbi:hypothetical protein A3K81_03350 [Candidatus Bathyarchaeota archaeon RBG_13_60_20]|nr:MAG: hypothetical protein A3K81_03350 [Candidatus Bathyarchaeota archaeon RBG_13_60_20]
MLKETARMLAEIGLPEGDAYGLPSSKVTFPDGANYRIEISGVENLSVLRALVDEMDRRRVPVHRLISTVMGSTLLGDAELEEFAQVAHDAHLEVILTPGPRALWDTGRQVATPEGGLCGIRYRGMKGLIEVVDDIRHSIGLGFKGFLVVGECGLYALSELRKRELIPRDVVFKLSIFAGHANPAGAKVLEQLGADTFNPVGDLTLPQLAAIRQTVKIPMDLHVWLFDAWGGFNRIYEAPEMARTCSPCYFKIEPGPSVGAMYKPWGVGLEKLARDKVVYAERLIGIVEENWPEARLSDVGAPDLAVPKRTR